ncbi:MAG: hypothetical protein ACKOZL_00535 [Actinomycetes bacterium]
MSDEQWDAVSVNLGCGGPHSAEVEASAIDWIQRNAGEFAVVFAQELPQDDTWRGMWPDHEIFVSDGPTFRPRSAVIVTRDLTAEPFSYATSGYHGSYVTAAKVGDVVLMSIHASPTRVSEDARTQWSDLIGGRAVEMRRCGLWDSDLVLETIAHVRETSGAEGVIAAGDWNEARNWDRKHPNGGGVEFFTNVRSAGFDDVCCPGDKDGAPTRDDLRIDHVFASRSIGKMIEVTGLGADPPADHRPVGFTIRL